MGKGAQVRGASPVKLPRREFLYLAAALPAVSRIALAQAYPARPVRMAVLLSHTPTRSTVRSCERRV
jgi:hypothetical protein